MKHDVGEFPVHFFGSNDYLWTYQARVFPYMDVDANSKEKMGKGVDATYKKGTSWVLVLLARPVRTCRDDSSVLPPQLWRRRLFASASCRRRSSSGSFRRTGRTTGSLRRTSTLRSARVEVSVALSVLHPAGLSKGKQWSPSPKKTFYFVLLSYV